MSAEFEAECAMEDAKGRMGNALTVLRRACADVWRVSSYAKEEPDANDLVTCNHACRVDLMEACDLLESTEFMLAFALDRLSEAVDGLFEARAGKTA